MKSLTKTLAVASVAAVAMSASTAPSARTITVVIHRVAQVDNLDKADALGKDRADFYTTVWIDGKRFKSTVLSSDAGKPETWRFSAETGKNLVPIRIKLGDDDGGLEEKDDYVDISPRRKDKDLNLTLNVRTGRITGEVSGKRGQTIHSRGKGDTDQGKIWFSIH